MKETVAMGFGNGSTIEVAVRETHGAPPGVQTRSTRGSAASRSSRVVEGAADAVAGSFEGALEGLRNVADSLNTVMSAAVNAPDEMTVSFGIDFSASARLIIAEGNSNASLNVTMTWRRAESAGG